MCLTQGVSAELYTKADVELSKPSLARLFSLVPEGLRFLRWAVGRAKGTVGLTELLLVTPREVRIYGPSPWARSLVGLQATTKGLEYVRLRAADGEEHLFSCGGRYRKNVISLVETAQSVVDETYLDHDIAIGDLASEDLATDEVQPDRQTGFRGRIQSGIEDVKALTEDARFEVGQVVDGVKYAVEFAYDEYFKELELEALAEHPEFSTVEELRQAFRPDPLVHGAEVYGGRIFGKRIHIYDKGFVQLGRPGLVPFEKLLAISASSDVQRKTGVGRGVAAGLTMGLSLGASSNRGHLSFVLVTDKDTYETSRTNPENFQITNANTVAAVGQGVLDALSRAGSHPQQTVSVADELSKLAALRDSGVLTEEDFQAAKSKLLGWSLDSGINRPAESRDFFNTSGLAALIANVSPILQLCSMKTHS